MPAEIRLIIFNEVEVLSALTEYRRQRNEPLPSSYNVKLTIRGEPKIQVTLVIVPEKDEMPVKVVFEREELAAALIMYCIGRKIPLPATGVSKTIQLFGDNIALQILKNIPQEQMEALSDLL